MRYRLVQARGQSAVRGLWHVEAPHVIQALNFAEGAAESLGIQLLVCEAPEGGLVREIEMVGPPPEKPKGKR